MIDIDSFILALKATWVTKLLTQTGNWRDIFKYYTLELGIKKTRIYVQYEFLRHQTTKLDLKGKVANFYIEMLLAFNNCKKYVDFHRSQSYHVLLQPIWGNINLMASDKCLLFFKNG